MLLAMMASASTEKSVIDCSDDLTVRKYYQSMAKYAVHKVKAMVGREEIAAEIVQEVFIKLWDKKVIFDHEKALYAWIYKSSHRAAIDFLRSAKVKKEEYQVNFACESIPLEHQDLVLERDLVNHCLRKLKKREAEILSFVVFDGMTQDEIADLMEVSRKTIQRDWHKIREKLEKILRSL